MKLFLGGDLMVGRGIDQILPHPGARVLYEPWVRDARDYVTLAERRNGPVPVPVDFAYPWGDALEVLDREAPDARIANLETSITDRGSPDGEKGIHYRLSPANVGVLTAAKLDLCTLANNHVLDWGARGLMDTLATLRAAGIRFAGAGENLAAAQGQAVLPCDGGRVRAVSVATGSSGVPHRWAAAADRPGVWRLADLRDATADRVAARATAGREPGDVAVVSIHWGPNWGYAPSSDEVRFAHRLIDAGVDLVHGHSSHHPRPVEVHRGRAILYGCGELVDDYEGIRGYDEYRADLVLLWLPTLAPDGELVRLRAVPMRLHRMRLVHVDPDDRGWLLATLSRICRPFGVEVTVDADQSLRFSGAG